VSHGVGTPTTYSGSVVVWEGPLNELYQGSKGIQKGGNLSWKNKSDS